MLKTYNREPHNDVVLKEGMFCVNFLHLYFQRCQTYTSKDDLMTQISNVTKSVAVFLWKLL